MEFNATIIVAFISFVVFVIIMNWILYKPIGDIVAKRQNLIDENYNEAKNNSEKSKTILQDRLDKLSKAHKTSQDSYIEAINKAKDKKEDSIRLAKENAIAEIEKQNNIYGEESRQAEDTLKKDIINLAEIISGKFIKTSEKIEIDPELVDKIMQG